MADVNGVGSTADSTPMPPDTLYETDSTEDNTSLGNESELATMPMSSESGSGTRSPGSNLLCFSAGVIDGALPLPVNFINMASGGRVARVCGSTYTAGNVVGTVGSMVIPGLGEANAAMKGARVLGRVKAGVSGARALGKHVVRHQLTGSALRRNVVYSTTKLITDSAMERMYDSGSGSGK